MKKDNIFPLGTGDGSSAGKLFCFYHAGGSAVFFRDWTDISESLDVVPVDIPRKSDDLLKLHFYEEAGIAAEKIALFSKNEDIFFYGHSLGALFAFETAYILSHDYKRDIKKLIVAGRHGPHKESRSSFKYEEGEEALIKEIKTSGGADERIINDETFRKYFLPVIMNGYRINEEYNYSGEMLKCPIVTLSGKADADATKEIMRAWQEVTLAGFKQYEFDGGHLFPYGDEKNKVFEVIKNEIHEILKEGQ